MMKIKIFLLVFILSSAYFYFTKSETIVLRSSGQITSMSLGDRIATRLRILVQGKKFWRSQMYLVTSNEKELNDHVYRGDSFLIYGYESSRKEKKRENERNYLHYSKSTNPEIILGLNLLKQSDSLELIADSVIHMAIIKVDIAETAERKSKKLEELKSIKNILQQNINTNESNVVPYLLALSIIGLAIPKKIWTAIGL